MSNILSDEGLSFDDVLLVPDYSAILPDEVTTRARLTKELELNVPIVSAAMDTVTESHTAISMARSGGLGFIHRNLSIEEQAIEVDRVKKSESGMIVDPVTIHPDALISEVLHIMSKYRISGVPVTEGDKLVGIVTNRDLRFETQLDKPVRSVMTSENLVTVPEKCTLEESKIMLHKHRIEKLLVVDKEGKLKGLITIKIKNFIILWHYIGHLIHLGR
jgi:IMP dehydrogenase